VRSDDSSDVHNKSRREYVVNDAVDTSTKALSIMRKQADLGSKARKERARKARARTERCVSREALLGSFVPDVLNLTMPCFIDVLPKKKMMRKCAGKQW
jgi:hypothetical protein